MIDTVKIFTMISKNVFDLISNNSLVKVGFHSGTNEVYYKIVNDKLEGSYSSSLSVRVGEGVKYKFIDMYYIEIEGSYHKIIRGYNSHDGFYNLSFVCQNLIKLVEEYYNIKLPSLQHWFLQRCDIAIVFDLNNNTNVRNYINNLSQCNFPRRNLKSYQDESIYLTGTTTTLKVYNKRLEFEKHDLKKMLDFDFDINTYLHDIDGFIRFECEIKKKKLKDIYKNSYVRVRNVRYLDLREVWKVEFMKLIKMFDNDLNIVRDREEIKRRLYAFYIEKKAFRLYNFYSMIVLNGVQAVKDMTNSSTFYRNIADLKAVGIDVNQRYEVNLVDNYVCFNPFTAQEVV